MSDSQPSINGKGILMMPLTTTVLLMAVAVNPKLFMDSDLPKAAIE